MELKKDRFDVLLDKARKGDADAQYTLALWLHHGKHVEQNDEAARYWAFKAADNGHVKAGTLYDEIE